MTHLPSKAALAVWRRNFKVWLRLIKVSLVLNLGEPLIFLLAFGYGLGHYLQTMQGLPYLTFLASGLIVSSAMTTASFEALYSVYTRMDPQKTYAAMLTSPMKVADIVAGELLWCATKGTISGVAILLVASLLGALHHWQMLLSIPVIFLTGLCLSAMAMVITPLAKGYDFFNYYYTLIIMPMFLCSGVFYPLDALPEAARWIANALPLSHALELARPLATGHMPEQVLPHVAVLLAYTAAGYGLASRLMHKRLIC